MALCLAASLLALFGAAAGSRSPASNGNRAVQSVLLSIALPVIGLAAVVAVVSVILLFLRRPQLPQADLEEEEVSRWARIIALLLALGVFAFCIYAIISTPRRHVFHHLLGLPKGKGHGLLLGTPVRLEGGVSAVTAAVFVATLAFLFLRRHAAFTSSRRSTVAVETHSLAGLAADPLPAALEDPALEADPRRAVILAYHSFVAHMSGRGLVRRESETPLEYARRLARSGVGARDGRDATGELAMLFNLARYASLPVTATDRRRALECLWAIQLTAPLT